MNKQLLERLSNAFGPPESETEPRNILIEELQDYADEVKTDKLGNVFFYHKGDEKAPVIMLAAHTDEVAVLITDIDDKGFLRFHPWGIVANVLPGQRMQLKGKKGTLYGILGTKPPHVLSAEERKAAIPADELFIDIGASSREMAEAKGAFVGMTGVFDVQFKDLGDGFLWGKAFDDRVGVALVISALQTLQETEHPNSVYGVVTVMEEIGLRGATTSVRVVDPDVAIILESDIAGDVPGIKPEQSAVKLGGGPSLLIYDARMIPNLKLRDLVLEVGEELDIPIQLSSIEAGATDGGAIHLHNTGVPTVVIGVAARHIHSHSSIIHREDYDNANKLLVGLLKRLDQDTVVSLTA